MAASIALLALAASPAPPASSASPAPGGVCLAAIAPEPPEGPHPDSQVTLTVAAASDLRYALEELAASFDAAHPGVTVRTVYGSSGTFFAQISQGAPFDVFLSADIAYPRALEEAGLAEPGATRAYAEGRLVTWVRHDSTIDVASLGLAAVLDAAAERVAIASPEHAPYGRAARAALQAIGGWEEVQPRLVLGESASQAAQFVESGAADVGILPLSLAVAPPLCAAGRHALVPADLHPPILQGALVLPGAAQPEAALGFVDHLLGDEGRALLERYGFLLPEA